MEKRAVTVRGLGWGRQVDMLVKRGGLVVTEMFCILNVCGGSYLNLYTTKLHRTIHTHGRW